MFSLKMVAISVFTLLISFIFIDNTALANGNSTYKFRDLKFETYRGLPRFGTQNSSGMIVPGEHMSKLMQRMNNNKGKKEAIGNRIEKHNYSLSLLKRLDFMHKYSECFKGMDKYEARTEICDGTVIDQSVQKRFWERYIETMAFSLTKQAHSQAFCLSDPLCTNRTLNSMHKKTPNGRYRQLNEFEKRSFVSTLMKDQHNDFQNYIKNKSFPKDAYFVTLIRLGDYDFDQSKFHFSYSYPLNLISQDHFGGAKPNTLTSKLLSASRAKYIPTLPFEKDIKVNRFTGIDLPMSASEAQNLVESGLNARNLYAVVKVKFFNKSFDTGYEIIKQLDSPDSFYHIAENKIELYRDEALTQKVAEVPITILTEKTNNASKEPSKIYKLDDNSKFLDYRVMSLLRYKKSDILESDMDRIAYSLPSTEKSYWIEHKTRLDQANKPLQSAGDKKYQETIKNAKRREISASKISNISWQDIGKLSNEQKKAYYNIMLGYDHYENNTIKWPSVFPAVPWGMNLVTIFRKGYLSDKREDQHIPVTKETRKIMQDFIRDLANHHNTEDLTLVYGLNGVTYDKKSKKLILNKKSWPFHRREDLVYTDGNIDKKKGSHLYINSKAKGQAVYFLRSSDRNIGDLYPNPQHRGCTNNRKTRSKDCITHYSSYMQMNFINTFLSLDKEVRINDIPLPLKKGINLTKYSGRDYAGWRVAVELKKADMDVIQYTYENSKTKKDQIGETQTLFAKVKRVLLISPDGEIIWSKSGNELGKPDLLTDRQKEKEEEKKLVDQKIKEAQEKQKAIYEKQKQLLENAQKAQEEKMAKIQAEAKKRQCKQDNINNKNTFNKCERLRSELKNLEIKLTEEEKNKCKSENNEENIDSTGCDLSNIPFPQISVKMQECITKKCGTPTAATMSDMADYQACTQEIGESIKSQMQNMMKGMSSSRKRKNNADSCRPLRQKITNQKKRMNNRRCSQHTAPPQEKDCDKLYSN